ncbi:MAG: FHA domain-containing protein [Lachnospiraceae bacterium]|nr:FHA domain-containing protein [Lachnospiraceae bacterium]
MAELLLSKRALTVYEILVILALIVILIVQSKKKKAREERQKINERKNRNTQLEERLRNPGVRLEESKDPRPFDVQYKGEVDSQAASLPDIQIELEVCSRMSTRKYLFDLSRDVTIGKDERNVLPVSDPDAAPKNCTIFQKNGAAYVRNDCASDPVCVVRGKKRKEVMNQMVKLENKDILTFGKTELHISLYKNKK